MTRFVVAFLVFAAACSSGGGKASHDTVATTTTALPDGATRTIKVDGRERTYLVHRPTTIDRDDGASLSKRGYCSVCGPARFEQHTDDLHYHRGEGFKQWRRAMAASVGGVLVDDVLNAE